MASAIELKLSPKKRPKERAVNESAELGLSIKQCYIAACGADSPDAIRIKKVAGNRYLEFTNRSKRTKRKRVWRSKLSGKAWKRIKNGGETLRIRRSEVFLGEDLGEVF